MSKIYDVIIIGGGVVGAGVLRELSYYNLELLLLEREDDVSCGTSKANSGIVHAGYDCEPGTLKALYNVKGCAMFDALCAELDVPYVKCGSLVVTDVHGKSGIDALSAKAAKNGVLTHILDREGILEVEPNISDEAQYALYAPGAGVVSPYRLTIAYADHAILNGAEILLENDVQAIERTDVGYKVVTDKGEYLCKYLINAAGGGAAEINAMIGDEEYEQSYRRGDYYVLDKTERERISTVIFPLPDEKGKGVLVAPTADGNVIYGPTSIDVPSTQDTAVTQDGLDVIRASVARWYKNPRFNKSIRVYAGVRTIIGHDFIIKRSDRNPSYYIIAGICSPGLTSAPAIAVKVAGDVAADLKAVKRQKTAAPIKHKNMRNLTHDEYNKLIGEDSRWGRIICRCEKLAEAEIVEAIHSPLVAYTTDAIKRRTRAGMGRCQGGFCQARIMEIIARELNKPLTEVNKGGKYSNIAVSVIKEDGYDL